MAHLIAQDCTVFIYDGGPYTINGPNYGAVIPITAHAKTVTQEDVTEKVDTRGWSDGRKRWRPTVAGSVINIEAMIADTGRILVGDGNFGQVVINPGGTAAQEVYSGLWTANNTRYDLDQTDTQTLVLDCDAG